MSSPITASPSESLPVAKLVATGNDFVFIDARAPLAKKFAEQDRAKLVRFLCDRHFGVGADGVVFVEQGQTAQKLKWDFYNSDGSAAEMCGNATRCMGRWAQIKLGLPAVDFDTVAGSVHAQTHGRDIESRLDFVTARLKPITFGEAGTAQTAYLVNTGVPHAVVDIKTVGIEKIDPIDLAQPQAQAAIRALRFHAEAGPRGANVTFLEKRSERLFATVTFERGVEDFTLSCGTGVLAAAAVFLETQGGDEADVVTPGGPLHVRYEQGRNGATLIGPANLVFETSLSEEVLRWL